ncbi:MAG TPA: zinc ribbon domain-containing protein [Alloacidobacterium sp.]|nr:zinc ribbon domain-containing protein [Alloacidobacterium sp.]
MPLYEYRCKNCSHQFEKIQSFSAPEEKVCPACGGEVERLLSAPAVQFKGSGWYVTDYAAKSAHKPAASGSTDSASKSETKPAASIESTTPASTPTAAPSKSE